MFGMSFANFRVPGLMGGQSRPVAVDFGTTALRILKLSTAEPPAIICAASLPTPDTLIGDPAKRFAYQLEQLPGLFRKNKIGAGRAVASIPAFATFCRNLQVGAAELGELNSYVAMMLSSELNCMPDALLCRPVIVEGANAGGSVGSGKSEVIAMATPIGVVDRIMAALRAAKQLPVAIVPESIAMAQAFDHMTARASDVSLTSLFLDLGYAGTRLTITHGRDVVFIKNIEIGGRYLDQHLSQAAKCTLTEAHSKRLAMSVVAKEIVKATASSGKPLSMGASGMPHLDAAVKSAEQHPAVALMDERRAGAAPGGSIDLTSAEACPADLTEPLSVLTDEIALCMRYHESLFPGNKIGRAIFVGGEARHVALCQHIAKMLRLPAHVADPLARFGRGGKERLEGVDLKQPQPGWCVCAGLAVGPTDL